ncbi:MAG: PEP-CTERM sorting domain-containing protein [Verrucomicrobia bacterium]|nr:PEP-CTERM sorting domain-containing protein [Verrucomicrobiota bacterium]
MKHLKVAALFLVLGCSAVEAQTVVYNATTALSGSLAVEDGVISILQPLNFSNGPGTYTITSMKIGVNFSDIGNGQQDIFLDFYNNLDLTPTSADALGTATYLTTAGIGLSDPPSAGSYAFTVNLTTPITLQVGLNFGVVISLVDDASQNYSSELNGLFRLGGVPSVGTNYGFVYNDGPNPDGVFPGSEQTRFNSTSANYYLSVTAIAAVVPEPSTYAMMLGGVGILLFVRRFRRA